MDLEGFRYFIYLSFDGRAYRGWQVQPGAETVQNTVERALATILRTNTPLTGAGRTDTDVHAPQVRCTF
jgi:tRNA pseudouridine38-40 synthase